MGEQLDFTGLIEAAAESVRECPRGPSTRYASIDERFALFNSHHPEVYAELVRMARAKVAQGRRRISVKGLCEALRESDRFASVTDGEFKINNSYTSRYARMMVEREPDLADVIELRPLKGHR